MYINDTVQTSKHDFTFREENSSGKMKENLLEKRLKYIKHKKNLPQLQTIQEKQSNINENEREQQTCINFFEISKTKK